MSKIASGFRSFFKGLRWSLLSSYLAAFKSAFWEIFWGASVAGIAFGLVTLFRAPSERVFLLYVLLVALLAGYAIWKPLHVRLTPKLEISTLRTIRSATTKAGVERVFLQVLIRCKTEAVLSRCRGQLLSVNKRRDAEWVPTESDEPLDLLWSVTDEQFITLEPGADKQLNVFHVNSNTDLLSPWAARIPLRSEIRFGRDELYRFDIRVAADECPPEYLSIQVEIGARWDNFKFSVVED
jgi:hypothetical protein